MCLCVVLIEIALLILFVLSYVNTSRLKHITLGHLLTTGGSWRCYQDEI